MEPLYVLVGPTASGKTSAAQAVAPVLDAEIVSLDSMLIYRGMDIGTDKPRDDGGVRHHLIDCLDPSEHFDVRRYIEQADLAIADIRGRGKRVLVAGGTPLYLMALLKGVFEGAPRDPELRARLGAEDLDVLHARLAGIDPATAARVHPNDRRRILRALEVFELTGQPLSSLQNQFSGPDRHENILAGIEVPRAVLKERIRARVGRMFDRGLVDEVRGLELGLTASQAVGYKEVLGALRGEYDMHEARRLIERNTLRLARRQSTWFRRFDIHWIDGIAPGLHERLLEVYRGSTIE